MYPLQASIDATMAVILLVLVAMVVTIFGFIWAFEKIRQPPARHEREQEHEHEHDGRPA